MRVVGDVVYADDFRAVIDVAEAQALPGHRLWLAFSDGRTGVFDMGPMLDCGVFQRLRDPGVFAAVALDRGVPTWLGGEVDIAPETLYAGLVAA
jgi:hypothetical protein